MSLNRANDFIRPGLGIEASKIDIGPAPCPDCKIIHTGGKQSCVTVNGGTRNYVLSTTRSKPG